MAWLPDSADDYTRDLRKANWAAVNMPRLDDVPNAAKYSGKEGSAWMILSPCKNEEALKAAQDTVEFNMGI